MAVALVRSGEVDVYPAGRGLDAGGGAVEQPGPGEPAEGGVAGSGMAVVVDVQDIGTGGAGGDGQVVAGAASEPVGDLLLVGGGVLVAVGGGGGLAVGLAGEDGPAAFGVGQGLAEGGVRHRVLRTGRGVRGWPQRVVSAASWAASAGRMRAWYSAWAETRPGVRSGWRYRTAHRAAAMSRAYRHRSWASQHGARVAARWP